MSETLADMVATLRADFSDIESATDSLVSKLEEVTTVSEKATEVTTSLADQLTAMAEKAGLAGGDLRILQSVLQEDEKAGRDLHETLEQMAASQVTLGKETSHAAEELLKSFTGVNAVAEEAGAAAASAAEQLGLFDEAMRVPYADAAGQLNLFASELEPIAGAAETAAEAELRLAQAAAGAGEESEKAAEQVKQVGHASEEAHEGAAHLLEELLKFAGIVFTLEKLKEVITEAFTAFAEEEQVTIALGVMMKSASRATETIEELKRQAMELAVPEAEIMSFRQRLATLDVEAEKLPPHLRAIADASAATKRSFSAVAGSSELMVRSGMAGGRVLRGLGLQVEDLAKVMGVSALNVQKAFKAMTEEERLEALTQALGRFTGAAKERAASLGGAWTRMKNLSENTFQDIGKDLEELGHGFIRFASQTIRELGGVTRSLIQFGKEIADLPTIVTAALEAVALVMMGPKAQAIALGLSIVELGLKWKSLQAAQDDAQKSTDLAQKKLSEMGVTLARQFENYPEFVARLQALRKEWQQGTLDDTAYAQAAQRLSIEFRNLHPSTVALTEEQKKLAIAERMALAEMDAEATKFHNSMIRLYNQLPDTYETYIASLSAGGSNAKSLLGQVTSALERAQETMEDMRGAPRAAMQAWVDDLTRAQTQLTEFAATDAFYQLSIKIVAIADKFQEQVPRMSAEVQAWIQSYRALAATAPDIFDTMDASKAITKLLEGQKELDKLAKKTEETFEKAWKKYTEGVQKAEGPTTEITKTLQDRLSPEIYDAVTQAYALEQALKRLGLTGTDSFGNMAQQAVRDFEAIATSGKSSLSMIELAWDRAQGSLSKMAEVDLPTVLKEYDLYIEKLNALGAAEGKVLAVQVERAELENRIREQQHANTTDQLVELTNIRLRQEYLNDTTAILGRTYEGVMGDFDNAFHSLGANISRGIAQAKTFGEVWRSILDALAEDLMTTLINAVLKWVEKTVVGAVTTKATVSALDIGQIMASAAVGAAAAYSAYAYIPFVGPALGAAAAAETYSAIAAFAPLAAFEKGGWVPEDMLALVHKGEYVVPAAQAASAADGRGTVISFDFAGATFHGVPSPDLMDPFMDGMVKRLRRAGVKI